MSKRYLLAGLLTVSLFVSGCGGDTKPAEPSGNDSASAASVSQSDGKREDDKGDWVPAGQDARAELKQLTQQVADKTGSPVPSR